MGQKSEREKYNKVTGVHFRERPCSISNERVPKGEFLGGGHTGNASTAILVRLRAHVHKRRRYNIIAAAAIFVINQLQ